MREETFPKQIRIENTAACNAECVICPREKLERPTTIMKMDFFMSLAQQSKDGQVPEIHLHGFGEPFIDKLIFDKIRYTKDLGIPRTYLVSNASLLNEQNVQKLLESGLDKIQISFLGTDTIEYDGMMRNLSYKVVKNNVETLLKAKRKLGRKKPIVVLKYIGPLWKLPKFVFQWRFKGAKIAYARLHNWTDGRQYNKPNKEKKHRTCPIVTNPIMQILSNGKAVPCCYDYNGQIVLGDLTKESIYEVWNGEKYKNFRALHREQRFEKIPLCNNCDKLR